MGQNDHWRGRLQCEVRWPSPASGGAPSRGLPPPPRPRVTRPRREPGRSASVGTEPEPTRVRADSSRRRPGGGFSPRSARAPRHQARERAGARYERSNCLGCQGALDIFLALHLLGVPGRPMLQHGVEYSQ